MFGIEMKVGPKRLYIVQRLREFLDHVERREAYVFSKHFTYDPKLHSFQKEDDAVIRQLIEIYHNEQMYHETSTMSFRSCESFEWRSDASGSSFLMDNLSSCAYQAKSVKLEQNDRTFDGIRVSDEPIPLHFEFDQTEAEGFQLDVQGLDKITVMESYGVVLSEGKLMHMQAEPCKRLSELKQMLEYSSKHQIQIPPEQMEPFMEKVIPGLMKLGSVHIAGAISDRIMQTPLKAKLYLDRVKDRLLAGLEFQYGDIVINPLEGNEQRRGTDRILMRDGDQERRILELMEQSPFAKTEEGYFMDSEDEEYEFLYHVVPQLEKLVTVYATSAVKTRLLTGHGPPKSRLMWMNERIGWNSSSIWKVFLNRKSAIC